ncbi:Uncharacterised protein [Vibrio cholerae]|nr:Uncharacterised protein [Vibrio cholerae]
MNKTALLVKSTKIQKISLLLVLSAKSTSSKQRLSIVSTKNASALTSKVSSRLFTMKMK